MSWLPYLPARPEISQPLLDGIFGAIWFLVQLGLLLAAIAIAAVIVSIILTILEEAGKEIKLQFSNHTRRSVGVLTLLLLALLYAGGVLTTPGAQRAIGWMIVFGAILYAIIRYMIKELGPGGGL